jgi:hypothetical protein
LRFILPFFAASSFAFFITAPPARRERAASASIHAPEPSALGHLPFRGSLFISALR